MHARLFSREAQREEVVAIPRAFVTPYRRLLQKRTIDAPPTVILWWGTLGYAGKVTAGDLHAVENLSKALAARGHVHAILSHPELGLEGHLNLYDVFALRRTISRIIFVCGPLLDRSFLRDFLAVHPRARKYAVGVSIMPNQDRMTERFDAIVARDGAAESHFDLAPHGIAATTSPSLNPPRRVGLCLRGAQGEYGPGRRSEHEKAERLFAETIRRHGFDVHAVDTELAPGQGPEQIAGRFADADLILTTRMHGALLGLAMGRPVIAIDQIPGTAKVTAVLRRVGWPMTFEAATVTQADIDAAVDSIGSSDIRSALAAAQEQVERLSGAAIDHAADVIVAP